MPVDLIFDPYASQEDVDYRREQRRNERFDRTMNNLSKLAQAYQGYRDNARERKVYDSVMGPGSGASGVPAGAGINIPQDPGGGVQFLSPDQLARNNQVNNYRGPVGDAVHPMSVLERVRSKFSGNSAMPLSSLERTMAETRIKNQYDPDYQLKMRKLEMLRRGGVVPGGQAPGGYGSDWQVTELDEYGQPKGYKNYRDESLRKQIEDYNKGLSGESSGRYGMAVQGEGNVDSIMADLGIDEQGNVSDQAKMAGKLIRAKFSENKPWNIATSPAAAVSTVVGNLIAGKEGQKLSLNYSNLVQNLLRLRTGAAAPIQEQIDEFVRTGYKLGDNPATTYEKLRQGKLLLQTVKNSIRPIPRFRDAQEAERYGFNLGAETKQFQSPEDADNSGLPVGTVVKVNGRPYQI